MTLREIIRKMTALRNEKLCTADFIIDQINTIEWKIKREIVDTCENGEAYPFDGYTADETDVKLIAPEPYSELYVKYIMMQIDIFNNSINDVVNSRVLFEEAYEDFSRWYIRNHMPLFRGNLKSEGYNI